MAGLARLFIQVRKWSDPNKLEVSVRMKTDGKTVSIPLSIVIDKKSGKVTVNRDGEQGED